MVPVLPGHAHAKCGSGRNQDAPVLTAEKGWMEGPAQGACGCAAGAAGAAGAGQASSLDYWRPLPLGLRWGGELWVHVGTYA